ncbi:MAG: riboflavin kinase / FMN adenylyltransferase [Desulfobacteraceae bacterium Eth-SRB1]|nr:MAG: riboflavin kinase / FMN adenylyltransferase [Desulfobacteraceae bacterium Eth-SRB1]
MDIIEDIAKIDHPYKNAVITIGNFDGVHIGHQALFYQVIEKARALQGTSVVMTFEPHPIRVLKQNNHPPLITLYEQKAELIAKAGIDILICIPFTREFASIPAKEFVEEILVKRIGMKAVIVGEDYTFGKNREGNLDLLKTYGKRIGFEVIVVKKIQTSNNSEGKISSTGIRELISEGRVAEARKLLGRHYQIRGTVMRGRDRGGRLLGFPTANINLYDELSPKTGVYAVAIECKGSKYNGVANIGYSPTFDDSIFTVEAHILDFNDDIYGQKIRVNFIKRLRDEKKFLNISELSDQIKKDINKARNILS